MGNVGKTFIELFLFSRSCTGFGFNIWPYKAECCEASYR
jgi:hypothetical protein